MDMSLDKLQGSEAQGSPIVLQSMGLQNSEQAMISEVLQY